MNILYPTGLSFQVWTVILFFMIKLKSITKKFQTDFWTKPFFALDDLSFSIKENHITGFLGANGAGKTTSIKVLFDFIKADKGEVIFDKVLGGNKKDIFRNIGYMPERPYFYPHLTGSDFVTYLGLLHELKTSEIRKSLFYWSERLKITHALDRKLRTYSKGMLQRLGLISSIIHKPKLLILDEPLSGLDPVGRKEIKDILADLGKTGTTIFFSSHVVADVEQICDRVVVLEGGKLLFEGEINRILAQDNISRVSISFYSDKKLDFSGMVKTIGQSKADIKQNIVWIECDIKKKDEVIKKIIEEHASILSVSTERSTLEEIIYKIKS